MERALQARPALALEAHERTYTCSGHPHPELHEVAHSIGYLRIIVAIMKAESNT